MKTPMQEMLEWVRATLPMDLDWPMLIEQKAESLLEKEKEVAQQYAEFAIECDRKELPVLEFDGWINLKHHRVIPTPLCETKRLKNNE